MFHNLVVYGIISTVNSFAFLRREAGGKSSLTRLTPAIRTDPTILYYFSNLCATTPLLVETHQDGRPITVIRAPSDSFNAPLVPPSSTARTTSSSCLSRMQLDPPRRLPRFQQGDESPLPSNTAALEELCLDIDVTALGTTIGCRGYKGVLHTGEPVSAKLWDGSKHSSEEADGENAIYNSLRHWGALVPRLIANGGCRFCPIVVLEFVKMISPLVIMFR